MHQAIILNLSYIYKWTNSLLANRDNKLQQLQMFKIALSAKYNRMKLQQIRTRHDKFKASQRWVHEEGERWGPKDKVR
jgi:hypothetical protein